MEKETNVFLFGAGAVLSWGAPRTDELTILVRESGYNIKNGNITITEFIYQKLISKGFSVNFETIINVIEELIVYYSQSDTEKKTPSLLSIFFNPSFEDALLNFVVRDNRIEHGFQLVIPDVNPESAEKAINNETPAQFYFQLLLAKILTNINAKISTYTYHTEGHTRVLEEEKKFINELFTNWVKMISNNKTLRLYTLNYDRLLKILLENEGVQVFEGFDCGATVAYSRKLRPDILRILTDITSNIYYNLHGSTFWKVIPRDSNLLPNPEIVLTAAPVLPSTYYEQATVQIEKGKNIMLTNIITGNQKAQKAFITPFKQMQSAFDRDCCLTEHIYVIGYSFGDEHINTSIKTALRYNLNLKITIVDPSFIKNNMDLEFALKIFPYKGESSPTSQNISDNIYSYLNGQIYVYTMDFEKYMSLQLSKIKETVSTN